MIADHDPNEAIRGLYGTTFSGGANNLGTVFKLTRPPPGQTQWTEAVLYSFKGGADGSRPLSGLMFENIGENSGYRPEAHQT